MNLRTPEPPKPPAAPHAESVDVCIVGSGPSGLAAAIELRRLGARRVLVVDREEEAGGIPRHADHIGFGMRDLHRVLTGPQYAGRYVRLAENVGVDLRRATTATDWGESGTLSLTSPGGISTVSARAVLLATGCRERPRAARLVPGDRPLGVLTTGALQQFVSLHHHAVGRRAIVVGAEHVSFSAVLTLAHAGAAVAAMITEHPRHQTYLPYKWLSAACHRAPILTSHRVTRIIGSRRVEAVEVTDVQTGAAHRIPCDTVVFTGDWVPDHELARRGGLVMDPATRGPRVDCDLRTATRGVFAAGNLVHAAETADIAALGGRHAARAIDAFLQTDQWPERAAIPVACAAPIHWVSPSAIRVDALPPLGRFTWRVRSCLDRAELIVRQGRRVMWRGVHRRLTPTLPYHTLADWIRDLDPNGEPVTFSLVG